MQQTDRGFIKCNFYHPNRHLKNPDEGKVYKKSDERPKAQPAKPSSKPFSTKAVSKGISEPKATLLTPTMTTMYVNVVYDRHTCKVFFWQ